MKSRSLLRTVLPPAVFGVGFIALWELAVKGFDLKPYFLAPPSKIWQKFTQNFDLIWGATKVSGTNALIGLLVGAAFGILMSLVLSRYRTLSDLVTPLAIALNAIPIFVLVAVLNNMFAITSEVPRRIMVTLVVYFIVLVNVAKGLTQVSPTHVELMKSYAASEYFGGSQNGLGSRIASNIANSKNAVAWAYVLGACLLGLAFYVISSVLEGVATPGGGSKRAGKGPGARRGN